MNEIVKELLILVGGVRSTLRPEYDKKRTGSKEAKENHGLNMPDKVFHNIARSTNSKGRDKHKTPLESRAYAIPLEDNDSEGNDFEAFNS